MISLSLSLFSASTISGESNCDSSDGEDKPVGVPYKQDPLTPVFSWRRTAYKSKKILEILLANYDQDVLCTATPLNVGHNVAFLVDNSKLKSIDDIRCDDMGSWINGGQPTILFKADLEDADASQIVLLTKNVPLSKHENAKRLKKSYYTHSTHKDVRKIISYIQGTFLSHSLRK